MRILIHGATNWGSSNFGDYLYVDAVCRDLQDRFPGAEIQVHQPSPFFLAHMARFAVKRFRSLQADVLVYAPGGYFGEGQAPRFRDNLIHFVRFLPVGVLFAVLRKPTLVVGVGAGPIRSRLLRASIRLVTGRAAKVVVRDPESKAALTELGVSRVEEGGDMILALDLEDFSARTRQVDQLVASAAGKKILFVHYNHSHGAAAVFADAVRRFMAGRGDDYCVVVGSDQILDSESELHARFVEAYGAEVLRYRYAHPYELVGLLAQSSVVVTSKLHVGVVGCMLGKSVISCAEHPDKTKRFYSQIGAAERCESLIDSSASDVAKLLESLADSPVEIPLSEQEKASMGWSVLRAELEGLSAQVR